jgi:thioredoxin-dependent peroxiredoxin
MISRQARQSQEEPMKILRVGDDAPSFRTVDQNGKAVTLADLKGRKAVLYFYPKDDTPGCTKEACGFRDEFDEFRQRKVEILGVSTDDEGSHRRFAEKLDLPFRLLADPGRKIVNAYGAWGEKSLSGRKYMGTYRVTYLIDEKGKIAAIWPKVRPEEHAEEILDFLDEA